MKLLVALCLLSATAFAGTVTFNASASFNCYGAPFDVFIPGPLYTISLFGNFTQTGQDDWVLNGGSVLVTNTRTGKLIFEDALGTGTASTYFGFIGDGSLLPSATVSSGTYQFGVGPEGDGSALIRFQTVPEPSSFLMVAAGLLCLCTIRTILPREN